MADRALSPPLGNAAWSGHPVVREIVRRREHPNGSQPGVKLGLVVEGGGMRGVYSGGALVAMEAMGLSSVFDQVYGESAGAINACYFLSRQGSFGIQIYLDDLTSWKFANPFRVGTMLDVDYAIDEVVTHTKALDVPAVLASPSDLFISVTSVDTGQPRVIDVKREPYPLLSVLKATAAIVPLYNRAVPLDGHRYVDGGISNPIPVASAIEGGCTHILVLLTREPDFVSHGYGRLQRYCLAPLLSKWPDALVASFFQRQSSRYNETREIALGTSKVPPGVQIAMICPASDSPTVGRATTNRAKLLAAKDDAVRRTREAFGAL